MEIGQWRKNFPRRKNLSHSSARMCSIASPSPRRNCILPNETRMCCQRMGVPPQCWIVCRRIAFSFLSVFYECRPTIPTVSSSCSGVTARWKTSGPIVSVSRSGPMHFSVSPSLRLETNIVRTGKRKFLPRPERQWRFHP